MSPFEVDGISMSTYAMNGYTSGTLPLFLAEAKADGANWIELSSDAQINLTTGQVSDHIQNGSDQTASLSSIGPAIAAAEALGLNVMLKPQVGTIHSDGSFANLVDLANENLVLSNPSSFFAGYKAYILQWAQLAQQYHVGILSIGNEMAIATSPQYTSYWDDIISAIRQVYSGSLTYSALVVDPTTTGPDQEVANIGFWNLLDYAGIEVYPNLTSQANPTVTQLNGDWQSTTIDGHTVSWVQYIDQLAEQIGKPVLFTEVGVNSYSGADADGGSSAEVGLASTQVNWDSQELWWQSFFDTWAVNKPSWLSGIFAWNMNPSWGSTNTMPYYTESFEIDGKPAELILASWFGGSEHLSWGQSSFTGSVGDDQIFLYGSQPPGDGANLLGTFTTAVSIIASAPIINGNVPTIRVYLNGTDEGAGTLAVTPGSYVDSSGETWTVPETFTYTLPGIVNISEIKVAIDSPISVGGPENEQVFLNSVEVNGTPLTNATYYPLSGSAQQQTIGGDFDAYDGGYTVVDASPWNEQVASFNIGTGSNPIQVNGGGGVDTAYVLGTPSEYTITGIGTSTVDLSEISGLDQNSVLNDITHIAFQDGSIVTTKGSPATVAQEINGLYVTLYGLAATQAGISYWENVLHNFDPGVTTANAASTAISVTDQTFLGEQMTAGSPIVNGTTYFATRYPATMSDMAFVQALYQNMSNFIGTVAGDDYWFNLLQQAEAANGGNLVAARESIAGQFVHDFLSNDLTIGAAALNVSQSDYTLLVNGQQALLNKEVTSQFYASETQVSGGSIINYTTVTDPAFIASHNLTVSITEDPITESIAIADIDNVIAQQNLSLI